jgi:uncharacterized protein with HEPN domain
MDKYVYSCLYDILSSIDEIDDFISANRTYDYYCSSRILQRAIERNLEIIAEAMI